MQSLCGARVRPALGLSARGKSIGSQARVTHAHKGLLGCVVPRGCVSCTRNRANSSFFAKCQYSACITLTVDRK